MNDSQIITLSLCGRIFKVPKHILINSEYFENFFKDNQIKEGEEIYIPRSPLAFEQILNHLIDSTYRIPDAFMADIKYFLLDKSNRLSLHRKYGSFNEKGEFFLSRKKIFIDDESCLEYGFLAGEEIIYNNNGVKEVNYVLGIDSYNKLCLINKSECWYYYGSTFKKDIYKVMWD